MAKRSPSEIAWGWDLIAVTLFWKLCPGGVTLFRKDMGALPRDRVLIEDRQHDRICFTWLTPEAAMAMHDAKEATGEKVGVTELQGRWHKIACVLLWKLERDKPVTLTEQDRAAVPVNVVLYTAGSRHEVQFRFMERAEAERLAKWHDFNQGEGILERPH